MVSKWNTLLMAAVVVSLSADGNAAGPSAAEVKLADSNKEDQRMRSALEADGWAVLEMETDLYKPGQLFRAGSTVPEASGCMDAEPISGSFKTTASEGSSGFVVSGGAALGKFGAGASANAKTFKLKSISDTTTEVIETIDFELNDRCTKYLEKLQARGTDLTGWMVIQQTLSARVKEVTCTGQEAALKVRALFIARGELGEMSDCTQSSDVTGVIAYKTRPVSELMTLAAPVAAPSARKDPQPTGERGWAEALLNWDTCDFGPFGKIFQEMTDSGRYYVDSPADRRIVVPFAKRVATSSTARSVLAEIGGRAIKSCDRQEWESTCSHAKARLKDYKQVRKKIYCTLTCEATEDPNWGYSNWPAHQADYGLADMKDCDEGCAYDNFGKPIYEYLKAKYGPDKIPDGASGQIEFIHRQTLRGIGTMEMNKLISTFCK